MFPHEDSLTPIFMWQPNAAHPEQIGTGVHLRMGGHSFLLTAAHVVDMRQHGSLCIPTANGISSIEGGIGGNLLADGQKREQDKLDLAYIRLAELHDNIAHPTLVPLERRNVDVGGLVVPGDFCSIGGYPVTQAERTNGTYSSAAYSYVGIAAEHSEYMSMGYDPEIHIVVKYHIKKGIFPEGDRTNPPHPRGLSGGGIFRLSSRFPEDPQSNPRQLVGVMHTFSRRKNCFVGTRVPAYLATIAQRFPYDVADFAET